MSRSYINHHRHSHLQDHQHFSLSGTSPSSLQDLPTIHLLQKLMQCLPLSFTLPFENHVSSTYQRPSLASFVLESMTEFDPGQLCSVKMRCTRELNLE